MAQPVLLADYLLDVLCPILANTGDIGGWRLDVEHPMVGSLAFTRAPTDPVGGTPAAWDSPIVHFYATPGWEGDTHIVIAVEGLDVDGAVICVECVDIHVQWTRDIAKDVGLYRKAMTAFIKTVNDDTWRSAYDVDVLSV